MTQKTWFLSFDSRTHTNRQSDALRLRLHCLVLQIIFNDLQLCSGWENQQYKRFNWRFR